MENTTLKVKDFNIRQIFLCGQCFRWYEEEDGSFTGAAFGLCANMRQEGEMLHIKTVLPAENAGNAMDIRRLWEYYLDLARDYGSIKKYLSERDGKIGAAIESGTGIRILRQEFWEAVVSFIISQNNNIPRIRGCIEKLCNLYGKPLGTIGGRSFWDIPEPQVLAELKAEDLGEVRLGYRASYLVETARQVVELCNGLETGTGNGKSIRRQIEEYFSKLNYDQAYGKLLEFQGVGPKVANCIALFGLGLMDSFPIDVWVKRVMARAYGMGEGETATMEKLARERFAPYGGIAQQYLFYHIRETEGK